MTSCKYNCKKGKIYMESLRRLVDCPECRNITKVLKKPDGKGSSIFDKLEIPPQYENAGVAGHELFNMRMLENFSITSINEVANLLERINKDLYSGKVTGVSCYIHTPNIIDIKAFVYGAQRLALEKGLGVTPFISCNTLYGLQRVGDYQFSTLQEFMDNTGFKDVSPDLILTIDGYRVVQRTDLTYYDFINADLCFIEATANTSERGWVGLADLLSERAKRGLPTYVIGYWSSSSGGPRGVKYLINPAQGVTRLDLLVPFEIKAATSTEQGGVEVVTDKLSKVGSTKSSEVTGLSVQTLMG